MRPIADAVAFTVNEVPSWNPINVCSYHLQEAGATPVQEIAFSLNRPLWGSGWRPGLAAAWPMQDFPRVFGRISFLSTRGCDLSRSTQSWRAMGFWSKYPRDQRARRHGVQVSAPALWRPGRTRWASRSRSRRTTCRESCRGPGRHARACSAPRDPAPRVERGAGPPAPVGPAVEPADQETGTSWTTPTSRDPR